MDFYDITLYVNKFAKDKRQLSYDLSREELYGVIATQLTWLKAKTVLDIGCKYGTLAVFLKRARFKIESLDKKRYSSKRLFQNEGIKNYVKDIETDQIEKYDAIILPNILESIGDPLPIMKKVSESCNGIILTTEAREFKNRANGKFKNLINWRQIKGSGEDDKMNHCYTISEIEDLLNEVGFKIEYKDLFVNNWVVRAVRIV